MVVGGSGRGVGKTALVCGLLKALPEFAWIAVKVTSHEHGQREPVWEETTAGQGSDTARYLAAGARRAFLIHASEAEFPQLLTRFWNEVGSEAHVLFESNRILSYLRPDLCLAIDSGSDTAQKPSFERVEHQKNAVVRRGERDEMKRMPEWGATELVFQLEGFERISSPMQDWLREHLAARSER